MTNEDQVSSEALVDDDATQEDLSPEALGLVLREDPRENVNLLLEELHAARGEASSYLDDLKRVAADFENFRKRAFRDQQMTVATASERVVRGMLPILDSLDAALAIETDAEADGRMQAGVRSTQQQLLDALAKEGLEVIPTWDEPFDPEVHEPVTAPQGEGKLRVASELRRGYKLGGRVLRPAMVTLVFEAE